MDTFEKIIIGAGVIVAVLFMAFAIFALTDRPTREEYYDMFSNYMKTNYEDIEVLEYSKDNAKKITITYNGASNATIVTYVKINGLEKLISCEIHDIIGDYGTEPYYTYGVHIYN